MGSALRAGLGGGRFQKVVDRRFHAREAGLGRGGGFLALFGGLSSKTFLNPSPGQLARRQGEETHIDGPEVARRGPGITPGPVGQMGNFNVARHAAEDEVGAWYAHHRLPSMAAMPGCIGARKLLATVGRGRHSILYEYVSLESCEEKFIPH